MGPTSACTPRTQMVFLPFVLTLGRSILFVGRKIKTNSSALSHTIGEKVERRQLGACKRRGVPSNSDDAFVRAQSATIAEAPGLDGDTPSCWMNSSLGLPQEKSVCWRSSQSRRAERGAGRGGRQFATDPWPELARGRRCAIPVAAAPITEATA